MPEPADLEQQLASLPAYRAPAGWQDSVRAAIAAGEAPPPVTRAAPSHRRWWAGGGLAIAAGVAIYLAVRPATPPVVAPLAIAIDVRPRQGRDRAMGAANVGDAVVIHAREAHELRVYRDGEEIARCPGEATCRKVNEALELVVELQRTGTIVAVVYAAAMVERTAARRPSAADLDLDVGAAARAQIKMMMSTSIEVR
jgi:hypothetical protein